MNPWTMSICSSDWRTASGSGRPAGTQTDQNWPPTPPARRRGMSVSSSGTGRRRSTSEVRIPARLRSAYARSLWPSISGVSSRSERALAAKDSCAWVIVQPYRSARVLGRRPIQRTPVETGDDGRSLSRAWAEDLAAVRVDRLGDRAVDVSLLDDVEQPVSGDHVPDVRLELREGEVDPARVELEVEVGEHGPCGGVDVGDRLSCDQDPNRWRVRSLDQVPDAVAELIRVREEERRRPTEDDQARFLDGIGITPDVMVARDLGRLPEHRRVRRPGPLEDVEGGQDHGDDDALEHADERDTERTCHREGELCPADAVEAPQLRDIEQSDRRRDDDCGK